MKIVCLHDKNQIGSFLRRNPWLHLYELGDLDDFFWEHTTWYGLKDIAGIRQLVLVYTGATLPVLIALSEKPLSEMRELLRLLMPYLPKRLYSHLSGNLAEQLGREYSVKSHGEHYKMALRGALLKEHVNTSGVARLSAADLPDLKELYSVGYSGNWFDSRMLETGCYFGIRQDKKLVSVAGVHVFSPEHKVAALGNITTHPEWRGRGLAAKVTAHLCRELLRDVLYIGLNVKAENTSAIACYSKLGFERIAAYEECLLEQKA